MLAEFNSTVGQQVSLHTVDATLLLPKNSSLLLSMAFALAEDALATDVLPCNVTRRPKRAPCSEWACVAIHTADKGHGQPLYHPLCGAAAGPRLGNWRQMHVRLSALGVLDGNSIDELVVVPGRRSGAASSKPFRIYLDEVWISSERGLVAGDKPLSYGQLDFNSVRSSWLVAVRPESSGTIQPVPKQRNAHFCEYMSSELGRSKTINRPLCSMDGDHLQGRWMQTCDPQQISRPDRFAYGRALPRVKGLYDYRLCYRQSVTERLRTLQTISWSWRPKQCAFAPVRGDVFDRWLGARTILLIGDSLSAQSFYSLLWLLGDAVKAHRDLIGLAPEDKKKRLARSDQRFGRCASSAGNEGGFVSEAILQSGGKLIKVMRHGDIVKELHHVKSSWLAEWLSRADFVVLNVGHHYHGTDASFEHYDLFAKSAFWQLERTMKTTAQLIFRTTNVGHHGCETATKPLRSRREAWERLASNRSDLWGWSPAQSQGLDLFADKYNWRGPPLFEHAWGDAAARSASLGHRFAYLNVSFLDARADGHVATSMRYSEESGKAAFPLDCLHYCYPGPTDYWALALYNLLLNNHRYQRHQQR